MNEKQDRHESTSLNSLARRYRDTKAPLGFAERVAAHARDETVRRKAVITPAWLYAASFAVVAVCSVLVVNIVLESEPELQLARQDKIQTDYRMQDNVVQQNATHEKTTTPIEEVPEKQQQTVDQQLAQEKQATTVTEPLVAKREKQEKPAQQVTQVARAVVDPEIDPNWDKVLDDSDFASVTVLWDVADWLDEGKVASPDFSDMPALGDIDALFEAT
jgi:hypothetical protein